jgi:glutathione S-transferase
MPQFELVSFHLCPYVQRSMITLEHKKVPYTRKDIDLQNPPEWFLKISPMGKVPVLTVDEKTVLFESAVINEYLDDVTEPRLNPKDPLARAKERAWIEYGSELLMGMFTLAHAEEQTEFENGLKEFWDDLSKLEPILGEGPYFRNKEFSLVDTSYAPFFLRVSWLPKLWESSFWARIPKTRQWAEKLICHPAVEAATAPDLEDAYVDYVKSTGKFLF